VWQAESQEDKDAAFGEFLAHTVRQKRIATVTSSNGVLTCQRGWTSPENRAEESAHVLSQPGSSNYHSFTTGPFQGYPFFKNKTSCIFITRVIIIQRISVFSFRYTYRQ